MAEQRKKVKKSAAIILFPSFGRWLPGGFSGSFEIGSAMKPNDNPISDTYDLEVLSTMRRYQDWTVSFFRSYLVGDAMEIGAGIGNIANHITPLVSTLSLVEPSSTLITGLREKFAVRECRRILRPGGHLLILVPALSFLYSKLDALAGHYCRYGSEELTVRIIDAGFRLEKQCYFDTLGIVPWWVLNIIGGATAFNPTLVNLYDRLFVPISQWLES